MNSAKPAGKTVRVRQTGSPMRRDHTQRETLVGLRLNTVSRGGIGLDHLADYEDLCAEMGWHLQFLTDTSRLEPVAPRLSKLRVPYIMDHMGHFAVSDGLQSAGMQLMLKLMADGAEDDPFIVICTVAPVLLTAVGVTVTPDVESAKLWPTASDGS